ncbi:MAG: PPOX class F420-dependent oxidoreductase [Acidimicrobiia bacterium]
MSVFSADELEYLQSQTLGRIATVGADGQPHVTPVTFIYDTEEDALDVGGVFFGDTKRWRDAHDNPKVTFLIDDVLSNPRRARALEIRGMAELRETGGDEINPRFPNFAPEFFRIRPTWIVSWGLEEGGTDGSGFTTSSRAASEL